MGILWACWMLHSRRSFPAGRVAAVKGGRSCSDDITLEAITLLNRLNPNVLWWDTGMETNQQAGENGAFGPWKRLTPMVVNVPPRFKGGDVWWSPAGRTGDLSSALSLPESVRKPWKMLSGNRFTGNFLGICIFQFLLLVISRAARAPYWAVGGRAKYLCTWCSGDHVEFSR